MRKLRLAVALSLVACKSAPRAEGVPVPGRTGVDSAVEAWLTTGDQRVLLERQPDLRLEADAGQSGQPVITVDSGKVYQEMIGFGAAMTDASAWLMQNMMTPGDREALLRDLFGRDHGVGMSFIRVTMGASDFSRAHYSYDDVGTGQRASRLPHFSIGRDRAENLPMLRRALAINPQLKIMASPWSAPAWMKTTGSLIKGT